MRSLRPFSAVFTVLVCWFVLAAPEAAAQQPKPKRPVVPTGFTAEYDVQYVPNGDSAQTLDIYYPEKPAEKPLPLLV